MPNGRIGLVESRLLRRGELSQMSSVLVGLRRKRITGHPATNPFNANCHTGDQFLGVYRDTMTVDLKVVSKCMRNKATLFDQFDNICYI